jgi:two-component system CheB/CheR fusion protein
MARKKPPGAPPGAALKTGPTPETPPAALAKPPKAKSPKQAGPKPGRRQETAAAQARTRTKAELAAAAPPEEQPAPEPLFPIVGIGASAGGLEAFTHFLQNLPTDTGMGFVLVQHMAPRAHSMLPEILAKATPMPVTEVRDGMMVEPNHVYVTPPDIDMSLKDGILRLNPRQEPRVQHRPVDSFLRSLGEDRGNRAIGVILSGTASDGVLGMKALKAEGGITFAQDESAKYSGMPQSSIAAGAVDFVLPPDQIAKELARIANHPYVRPKPEVMAEPPVEESEFNQILRLLRLRMGVDFTYYKHNTIKRRILRRMVLHQVEKLRDYLKYLQDHPEEVKKLYEDVLINVTGFFRDPESFEALKETVFPAIAKNSTPENPVRIWVPGCATGEEAYSIAIALLEYLGERAFHTPIQVFATDVEESVINKARAGIYPESIGTDVSPERLRRFFTKVTGGYQISKPIREMCVFAMQNLIKDPPFSRLDLISCRNVLIYLGLVLQKKAIPLFHFALKPHGFLWLGKSETIGAFPELFTLVDKKTKSTPRSHWPRTRDYPCPPGNIGPWKVLSRWGGERWRRRESGPA